MGGDLCSAGCKWDCTGCGDACEFNACTGCSGCTGTCDGCEGCSSCRGCRGCTDECTGCVGCTSCEGCSGSCQGKCNSGCKGDVAQQAYNSLLAGLNEYITAQDIKNIYLIFEAIKNRRADAGIGTTFTALNFTKDIKTITYNDIQSLSNNASNTGFGITDNTIIQNKLFYKTTAEKLKDKAINGYSKLYGR